MDYHQHTNIIPSTNFTYEEFSNSTDFDYVENVTSYSYLWNIFLATASGFLLLIPITAMTMIVRYSTATSEPPQSTGLYSKERKLLLHMILSCRTFSKENGNAKYNDKKNGDARNDVVNQHFPVDTSDDKEKSSVSRIMKNNSKRDTYPLVGQKKVVENNGNGLSPCKKNCDVKQNMLKFDYCVLNQIQPIDTLSDEENPPVSQELHNSSKHKLNLLVGQENIAENNRSVLTKYQSLPCEERCDNKEDMQKLDSFNISEEQRQERNKVGADTSNNDLACSICLSEFIEGDKIMHTKNLEVCNHVFHQYCLLEWLESHNECPMCRYEMVTNDALNDAMTKLLSNVHTEEVATPA